LARQDSFGEKEREITLLKKQLEAKDRELRRLSYSNTSLEESQDEVKMKLANSKLSVERLERDKKEAKGEVERLRREVGEERLVRQKEKGAMEKDAVQLQRKVNQFFLYFFFYCIFKYISVWEYWSIGLYYYKSEKELNTVESQLSEPIGYLKSCRKYIMEY